MAGIKTVRTTTSRIIIWASSPEIVRLAIRVAKLLQIEYIIPDVFPKCTEQDVVIAERCGGLEPPRRGDFGCRILYLDPMYVREHPIDTILSIVKALRQVREASIGIDVGTARIAYAVLAAGAVLLADVQTDIESLLADICSALRTH